MGLASNTENIRFNGTGRAYVGAVGGSTLADLGELEGMQYSVEISEEEMKSTRNAARATILQVESERKASLAFGLREMSEANLKMALLGSAINTDNQAASYVDQVNPAFADDLFIDLGYLNLFTTKLTGVITDTIAVGDTLTGADSAATGLVAYVDSGYVILVNVSGTFESGEKAEKDASNYITLSGIETLEDVCVTDSTGATLRAQVTDYSIDPDYGYLRKLSSGNIVGTDVVSFDYEAVDRKYIHGLSAGAVEKKIIVVADKDDTGPRQRWTFHKVKINLNGDFPLIGDGAAIMQVSGGVLMDTGQASGQEFYKLEMM